VPHAECLASVINAEHARATDEAALAIVEPQRGSGTMAVIRVDAERGPSRLILGVNVAPAICRGAPSCTSGWMPTPVLSISPR
jgi:hypothetical protein